MNNIDNNKFDIELMNQVNDIVTSNFLHYRCTDYDFTVYYPIGINRYKIKIELHWSIAKPYNSTLVLKYRNNPANSWIQVKFNYSVNSMNKLVELLETLNISLHKDNTK